MKPANKPLVVFDTNVWLSGLIFGGTPEKVLRLFIEDYVQVVTSEEILSELRRNITLKFPFFIPKLNLFEISIREDTMLVQLGSHTVSVSRDPDDDRIIETAIMGGCEYIVSGDKDLLSLGSYEGITILTPVEFLRLTAQNHQA